MRTQTHAICAAHRRAPARTWGGAVADEDRCPTLEVCGCRRKDPEAGTPGVVLCYQGLRAANSARCLPRESPSSLSCLYAPWLRSLPCAKRGTTQSGGTRS